LQAAVTAKSAAVANSAGTIEVDVAHQDSDVCSEPHVRLDFSVVNEPEALRVPLVLSSKVPAVLESPKAVPVASLVLIVRAGLWLLSLCFFASGAMRCLPCKATPNIDVATCETTKADSPVFVLAPESSEILKAALAGDDARCESLLDMEGLFAGSSTPQELTVADAWGTTALHAAAAGGSHIVAELFLEFGVHVDPVDAREETPLHLAARGGHVEVCELLVTRGASLNALNAEHLTPLAVAGYAEQASVCKRLLVLGASFEGLLEEELPDTLRELVA